VLIHTTLKKNWRMSAGEKRKPVEVEGSEGAEKRRKEEKVTVNVFKSDFPPDAMSWIVGKVRENANVIMLGSLEDKSVAINKLCESCRFRFHGAWKIEWRKYTITPTYLTVSSQNYGKYLMILNSDMAPGTVLRIGNYRATPWPSECSPEDSNEVRKGP
jgi:hypothetical protein